MKNNQISILIVDDHPAVRNTMIDVLDEEGFNTDHADNGEVGLKKCLENSYDFVLIDVQMPKMNGVEVLRDLKKQKETIPCVYFCHCILTARIKTGSRAVRMPCVSSKTNPNRKDYFFN
jgi:DNA-binding response OmpR family regulator